MNIFRQDLEPGSYTYFIILAINNSYKFLCDAFGLHLLSELFHRGSIAEPAFVDNGKIVAQQIHFAHGMR